MINVKLCIDESIYEKIMFFLKLLESKNIITIESKEIENSQSDK